jgi:hypothetical protein
VSVYGRYALQMQCPHCGAFESHSTKRTYPKNYHFRELRPLFERLALRDMLFRKRTKECHRCSKPFISVEVAFDQLEALFNEVTRLTSENERLVTEVTHTKEKAEHLQYAVDRATKMLSPVATKLLSHGSIRGRVRKLAPRISPQPSQAGSGA